MNPNTPNRFERHPVATWAGLVVAALVALEIGLRLFTPRMVRFAHDYRKTYRYHDEWYADLDPGTWTLLHLRNRRGHTIFNFLVTVGPHGFRTYDRRLDNNFRDVTGNNGKKVIHATGDSFCMGWGGSYVSSYPAQLDFMLPREYRVINLGMNGYGAVGALGKSRALSDRFPPAAVVYLASSNDYMDDRNAERYRRLPWAVHRLFDAFNVMRRHVYFASIPYALRWWLFYRGSLAATDDDFVEKKVQRRDNPADFTVVENAQPSDPSQGTVSKQTILDYSRYLSQRGIPFIVIGHGTDPGANLDLCAFCREQGIETYLLDVPGELRLAADGHFSHFGNYRLALFVRSVLEKRGVVPVSPATHVPDSSADTRDTLKNLSNS
ncbi:MAG: hypothetical protein GF418_16925 [Chitinivibrionales bacterium]|nr:hypothetical protein [Chitinivibrionales bacterium]MBD3397305.1 hypothetical protein [Chitinivibrionales bacterium]